MANLARMLAQMGKQVSGSDTAEEFITDKVLAESTINVVHSFEAKDLPVHTNLVIYSAAHGGINNAQVQEAQKRGIQVKHQVEVLGEMMNNFKTSVAVCGCHGKTTTSAFLSYALKNLGSQPSYMVGVSDFNDNWGGEYTGKDIFVAEADEYGLNPPYDKTPKINFLSTTHAICMNIDFDHPDVYDSLEQTQQTFFNFFNKTIQNNPEQSLFLCGDDVNLMKVASQLPREVYQTYGYTSDSDWKISNLQTDEEGTTFKLTFPDNKQEQFTISMFGEKSVSNAAGVIAFLITQGYNPEEIRKAIRNFTGAKRRFEKVSHIINTYIFDDYAHHPHEIEATLGAAQARFPSRRILVLFQPHTFTRTESLKHEFIQSLAKADYAFILPIFGSARETVAANSITSIDLENLAQEKGIQNVHGFASKEDSLAALQSKLQQGDVIFTMGAGDVYKLKNDIEKMI